MRIVVVWCVAMLLMLTVSIGWYVSLPVAYGISSSVEGKVSGAGLTALRIVEYVALLWGPLFNIFIVLWAFLESHRVDVQGVTYGG